MNSHYFELKTSLKFHQRDYDQLADLMRETGENGTEFAYLFLNKPSGAL